MAKMGEKDSVDVKKLTVVATETTGVEKKVTKKQKRSMAKPTEQKVAGEQKAKKLRWPAKIRGSGLIFIKHLPKGFYETELRHFFQQFGDVARVCVARSRKTQQCKGYGYVHFRYHEVAEIAADAVNNYMMFGRVLKATALPKHMMKVPRNFGRAFNSKGEQTAAYRKWLQSQVRKANSHLGPRTLLDRVSKQVNRLKRAEQVLLEAGIELPEMNNSMSKLKAKTIELKEQVKENLAKRAAANKEMEMDVKKVVQDDGDDGDDDEEDEDDETAFTPLQPSDWKETERSANETTEPETSKAEAIKLAQEKGKEFMLSKRKTDTSITTSNKENKKGTPAKKQPKAAKPALLKKKQSEKPVVPNVTPKVKGKLIAKDAKSAKLGRKVK